MTQKALKVAKLPFGEKLFYMIYFISMVAYGVYVTITESKSNTMTDFSVLLHFKRKVLFLRSNRLPTTKTKLVNS